MVRKFEGLKAIGSKAGRLLLAGTLAIGLAPGLALADDGLVAGSAQLTTQHYEYENATGKVLSDPLNGQVKRVDDTDDDHVYQYMGYVHSDGSHYQPYSLYTEITTDDSGVITALDITSGNDMWAGKWGNNSGAIEGFLPDGVDFSATQNSDGTWSPVLSGATEQGYKVSNPTITIMSVNADGTADALDVSQNPDGMREVQSGRSKVKAPAYTSISGTITNGKITIPSTAEAVVTKVNEDKTYETGTVDNADYFNLVKCAYTLSVDTDKTTFNTYFTVGAHAELADQYIDTIPVTEWPDNPESGYTTNRDGWTGLTGTLTMRMLPSWNAYLQDTSISTDLDGDIASIDTVSGATKTSLAFVNALNKAAEEGFVTGVAEDVKLTIDGNDDGLPTIDINNNPNEGTTVVKNDDGTYTVNALHRKYGGGRLSFLNVYAYGLSDQTVGTQGMIALAKESYADYGSADGEGAYKYLKQYNDSDTSSTAADKVTKLVAYNSKAEDATVSAIGGDDEYISLTYTNDGASAGNMMPITLTTKSPKVTHVVFKYLLGHATFAIAYDLEEMAKASETSALLAAADAANPETVTAARKAYEATPYDVRPFVSGLDVLKIAEAGIASQSIADADVSTEEGYTAMKAAYDMLDSTTKANLSDEAKAKIAAAIDAHTVASAILASTSATYTGKAITPAVTVKAVDSSTIDAANYDVAYAGNVNAGTATVTVTGKGNYTGSATAKFAIAKATIAVPSAKTGLVYTGKAQTGVAAGTGYTVKNGSATNAGTYTATLTAAANYQFAGAKATAAVKYTIAKAKGAITAKAAKKTLSAKAKKKTTIKAAKAFKVTKNASKGKVTYKKTKGDKKITVAANGKITVKKGLKKGLKKGKTYTIKVKATSAATANYAAATSKVFNVKIKVS